jgi:hypothetical protein
MGGAKIGPLVAKQLEGIEGRAVVEVGAWLGGLTQHIAHHRPLYVYDKFISTQSEVEKAKRWGVDLAEGQDTLPLVRSWLPKGINFVKGNLRYSEYDGPPIAIYIDDASKHPEVWKRSMETFEPHFENTLIYLMDYHFPPCEVQREYAKKWTMVTQNIKGTCCAVFRC